MGIIIKYKLNLYQSKVKAHILHPTITIHVHHNETISAIDGAAYHGQPHVEMHACCSLAQYPSYLGIILSCQPQAPLLLFACIQN